jgi:pilus assembly protein FimV
VSALDTPKTEASAANAPAANAPAGQASAVSPSPQGAGQSPQVAPIPVSAPAVEVGLFDDVLDNPYLLPALGGIALLGAGYGWYAVRRRRKVESFEDSLIAADAFTANSLFGATGGQSVDTRNSVFAPVAPTSAADVHSTEVDPIAEADVYIAYGREGQAEEILKEALRRQPERQAIRAKLAEIYSGRKDVRAFEAVAREMHQMTGGRSEEWPKVAAMGLGLDPTNPLYGGTEASRSASSAGVAAAAATAAAATVGVQADAEPDFPELKVEELEGAGRIEPEFARSAQALDDVPSLDFDLHLDTAPGRVSPEPGDHAARFGEALADAGAALESSADRAAVLDSRFELPTLDLSSSFDTETQSLEPLDLDLPALEGLTEISREASAAGMDLSPLDLDLEPAGVDVAEASVGGAGRWQEMATKLDLASAYEEIGDKDGARELLQEVIKGGDSGQQQKARAMLSKIG